MKHTLKSVLCSALAAVSLHAFAQDFWQEDVWQSQDRGFLYYPSPEEEKAKEYEAVPLAKLQTIDEVKAERERRLSIAVMRPTDENMKSYLEANYFVQEKSALFADQWRRAIWQNPQFDYTTVNPAANFAQVDLKAERNRQKEADLTQIAKEWGLVYFYRGDCRFCHLQSPLIRKLADDYGFEVLAISIDGSPNALFPDALPDNGIGQLLTNQQGISSVPALFMVKADQSQSYLIASGVQALDEMTSRIALLATKSPGESLFGGFELIDTTRPNL